MDRIAVHILGRIATVPQLQRGARGVACFFTVAVNQRWKDRDGEPQERAEFLPIVAFGKAAEHHVEHLVLGQTVSIEAGLRNRTYEVEGEEKRRLQIEALGIDYGPKPRQPKPASGAAT